MLKKIRQYEVWVTTQFEAMHSWPEASGLEEYLRHPHRHMFGVSVSVVVGAPDRKIEFFALKRFVDYIIRLEFAHKISTMSCEQMAEKLGAALLQVSYLQDVTEICVTISEDGENGATVTFGPGNILS